MRTLEQEFEDHMDESLQPESLAREKEAFRIDNDGAADWALRKLAVIEKRMKDADALADQEIQRVTEWLKAEQDRYENDRAWFVEQLEAYHRSVLAEDARRKTINLPAGALVSRKAPDGIEIEDDEALLAWALDSKRDDLVRVKREIAKSAVKHAVLKDGEVLPHVTRVEGAVSFNVKTEVDR